MHPPLGQLSASRGRAQAWCSCSRTSSSQPPPPSLLAPFPPGDLPALGLTFDSGLATSLSTSPRHYGPLFHHLLHPRPDFTRLTSLQAYTLPVLTRSSAHSMNTHHFYPELTVSTGLPRREEQGWTASPKNEHANVPRPMAVKSEAGARLGVAPPGEGGREGLSDR